MPAMGPLPQEIRLVIHLGYAGHEGSERLQAGKEKLIGGQKAWLRTLAKGGAAESGPPRSGAVSETQSFFDSRESKHSLGTGELFRGRGAICLMSADTPVL